MFMIDFSSTNILKWRQIVENSNPSCGFRQESLLAAKLKNLKKTWPLLNVLHKGNDTSCNEAIPCPWGESNTQAFIRLTSVFLLLRTPAPMNCLGKDSCYWKKASHSSTKQDRAPRKRVYEETGINVCCRANSLNIVLDLKTIRASQKQMGAYLGKRTFLRGNFLPHGFTAGSVNRGNSQKKS